ncbi:MAG TPA: hypothetical protein PK325_09280 [Cyclobacteriaceae bacterium]|nr:hypothetical protein [Cyclobacteriaceae bacterium]HMV08895.1 hypothetical protein [Cyclobacteriaceae bacterium]HMV89320.1 hypothetical protein [Cyclobacteriaceae bacterium]HMX00350.1 hypothetical protein [Cyclobacteriaceae bacterium]HMX49651.1 hypothetical protein [Cyclobacteriaceae bacterium]
MKSLLLFALSVILTTGYGQETELDRRNGFKDIKLASPIDSIKGATFKKDFRHDNHAVKLYVIEHPDYASIGEVKVNQIEAKTYKGLIYQLTVRTEKDTRLMKGMESALGKPIYNVRDESYNWVGEKLGLKFRSHSKSQLELEYTSTIVLKMMQEDKKQKIKDIANDF